MSFTFASPAGPETGLQGYNLDGRPRSFAPETAARRKRRRSWLARRAKHPRHKDSQMQATLVKMVDTLKGSVDGILAAQPENAQELLAKSFKEFSDILVGAVGEQVEALEKRATDAATPLTGIADGALFTGLGPVGEVANLLSFMDERIDAIRTGARGGKGLAKVAPPDDAVLGLLDRSSHLCELALRAAVHDHLEVTDDKAAANVMLKSADGAEQIMLKCNLPEALAKFATDPDAIDDAEIEDAVNTLIGFGVSEAALVKALSGGGLAKFDGMEEAADTDGDGQASMQEQLVLVGRLLAAAMLQLNGAMEGSGMAPGAIDGEEGGEEGMAPGEEGGEAQGEDEGEEGGEGEEAGAEEGGEGAGSGEEGGEGEGDEEDPKKRFGKTALNAGLAKMEKANAALQSKLAELEGKLVKIAAEPAAGKAILMQDGTLSKREPAGPGAPLSEAKIAEIIANKVPETDRPLVMMKIAQQVPAHIALAKYIDQAA